jgi:hypothetical protein
MNKILLLILLFCIPAQARWFELQDLYLEAKTFTGRSNDYVNQKIGRNLDKDLNLGLNVDFMGFGYFNNIVDARTGCIGNSACQFSEITYNFKVGARIFQWLDLVYSHQSQHALDNNFGYQVEDSIGIRLYLINSDRKDSLLP